MIPISGTVINHITFGSDDTSLAAFRSMLHGVQRAAHPLGSIDFNKLIPMPQELAIEHSDRTTAGLKLYRTFMKESADLMKATLFAGKDERSAMDDEFRAKWGVIEQQNQEIWVLGEQAHKNIMKYDCPTWYEWRNLNWGTASNATEFADLDGGGDTISEQPLIRIVAAEIKDHAQAVTLDEAAVADKLKRRIENYDVQRISGINQEVRKLRRQVQELEAMIAKLYEDKYSGTISETTFIVLSQKNEQERLAKANYLQELLSEAERVEKETAAIYKWTSTIRKYLDMQELDRAVIDELIDHIEVGERTIVAGQRRQDIKVFYHFVGLVE